jgi:hypothetical protein
LNNSTATLKNTIVSGGSCFIVQGTSPPGTTNDGGYNLDSGTSCGFSATNNSLSGVDPMLGPLAANGGPTLTHALLEGSPAIDKGNSFGATTDQRGLVRPSNFVGIPDASGGNGSDIGAFELQQPAPPDTTPPKVMSTSPGNTETRIAPGVDVTATFSEHDPGEEGMMASSITGQTFKLFKKGSTTKIGAAVAYSASTDTATLNPTNNLRRGVTYKAVVTTGAKDLAGNRLDQDQDPSNGLQQKAWTFTIRN